MAYTKMVGLWNFTFSQQAPMYGTWTTAANCRQQETVVVTIKTELKHANSMCFNYVCPARILQVGVDLFAWETAGTVARHVISDGRHLPGKHHDHHVAITHRCLSPLAATHACWCSSVRMRERNNRKWACCHITGRVRHHRSTAWYRVAEGNYYFRLFWLRRL